MSQTVAVVANWDWVLFNYRLPVARGLRDAGLDVVLISPPGEYEARLRDEGFDFEPWGVSRRGTNPLAELRSVGALAEIYRRRRICSALHFTMKPIFLGTMAARLAGVPTVVNTFTGLGYLFTPTARATLLRVALMPYARAVLGGTSVHTLVHNPVDGDALRAARWIGAKAPIEHVQGSGVDLTRFTPVDHDRERISVIFAGRLLATKGVRFLVEAAALLRQWGVAADVTVLGDPDVGNPDAIDPMQIEQWKSEGVVNFPGHVDDVSTALMQADVAVLPSEREGLSRFLLEACAAGLPIVATDVPGNRHVVDEGVTGFLVPHGDAHALAQAIARLASDRDLRKTMGAAAREKAERRFSETAVARVYVQAVTSPESDQSRS